MLTDGVRRLSNEPHRLGGGESVACVVLLLFLLL